MKPVLLISMAALVLTTCTMVTPSMVRVVRDIDYMATTDYPAMKDRLDLYIPAGARNAPVIVLVHGGGLRAGDKSGESFIGHRFASAGNITVVVNYRLSPAVKHPAHVEDIAAAVAWVKRNVSKYGGDPDNIFVIGHSAGAYLAALLVLDPAYLAVHRLTPHDIRGVVSVSGFFYVDRAGVAPDRPKDTWGAEVSLWKYASPSKYVRKNVPPLLILYADGDEGWRKQQQEDFLSALRQAGALEVEARLIKDRNHTTVWTNIADNEDETSRAVLGFVNHQALQVVAFR